MKAKQSVALPTVAQLRAELNRVRYRTSFRQMLLSTVSILLIVAAAAVLAATIWMPVLQIFGSSMSPALNAGDIVLSRKSTEIAQGDLIAFYFGNKLLVKRCIAGPGQLVEIDADGNVSVDGELLEEPYLTQKALGECDLDFPYLVPENRWFCMGDQRATSLDSRHSSVGCVSDEQIVGKIALRVWPLAGFGAVR